MKAARVVALGLGAIACGCSGNQSALHPYGAPAIHVEHLIVGIVALCTVVWVLVMATLGAALWRRRQKKVETEISQQWLTMTVTAALALTVILIAGMTIASFYTTRAIGLPAKAALTITLKAQQWWWQVTYAGSAAMPGFQTANEIHIPVGQDVQILLESADVIHSFWVPSLAGKQDLVPGRSNSLLLRAEKPGVYRGQCAEFCGLQHSHMAVLVIAEAPADYTRWAVSQSADAIMPAGPDAAAGRTAFLAKPCAACHTVRGTAATGTSGPDLTHVGSRQTIAAGLVETTRGSLAAWIADPQTLKPGNNMPMVPLTSFELQDISAYMESLK
ncbi:cytochrome c oxidase subunit II [Mesorhizobium neociceri]|uniref:cytochrome-c oxidase n=1 Tax=Mesorhizobium neociceri TaxID=1307853 RepID=A0A838BF55_9HYPH|nr:cytochrome c oxidase subunit II [Mesorhizobium neociceri]MBA1144749.1 cytochrome c oxidase subunit II [Mesorhizobium neociceri]